MNQAALLDALLARFPYDSAPSDTVSDFAREIKPEGAAEIEAELQGRPWKSVPIQVYQAQAPSLSCLTVEAFVHFIPGFLRAALADPESDAATYSLYALAPLDQAEGFYDRTCRLFSPDQAEAIARVLQWLSEQPSFRYQTEEFPLGLALWKKRALDMD